MRFSDVFKCLVSFDTKKENRLKIRIFTVPVLKVRTKKFLKISKNIKDFFFYRRHKNVTAIKCPSPCDEARFKWGDFWIAEDLKKIFEKNGQTVRIDFYERFSYPSDHKNSRTLTLRGLTEYVPPKDSKGKHILYLLSHPDIVPLDEMSRFNAVACASLPYSEYLKKEGINCFFVPQFTDSEKFFPAPSDEFKTKLLFVGNSRGIFRNCVKFALEKNLPITVYGGDWEQFGVKTAGTGIKNTELHKYYSSADIVLCDHWEDMAEKGFIANRIYDASACGAFIISDYVEAIERLYGDSIPMYRNADELKELVDRYLNAPSERKEKAERARKITLKNFNVEKIALQLNELFDNV